MSAEIDYIAFYQEHTHGLKSAGKDEYRCHCPFPENHLNGDRNPSFSINAKTGQYYCHACKVEGNLKTFCKEKGIPYPGQKKKWVEPEAFFDYRDEHGTLLYQTCRFPEKNFKQRRPDDNGGWIYQVRDVHKVPYRLPELLKADPDKVVFIPEGEKHVNRLYDLGLIATCNVSGAEKWTSELNQYFKDRKVCILPDNDLPGRRHGQKVAHSLCMTAREIRILNLPNLPPKGDIINWLNSGGTVEELFRLLEQIPIWKPEAIEPDKTIKGKEVSVIDELNQKHAVIMIGGKCVVLNETFDHTFNRPDITFSSPVDFKNFYANKLISIEDGDGNLKTVPIGKHWFSHSRRRQYNGITFVPLKETPGQYNLWRGFSVKPIKGDCSLYLEHLKKNIAQEDEEVYNYLIAWEADAVQNPAKRPGTSIVLRGKQGTGKGVAISEFGKLFGPHFIQVHHSKHLVGNFNAHLKDILLVSADEAFWAGDKSAEGVLKAMVTEEYMQIEPKGKDTFRIKNYIRLMISSNNEWVVPAGLEERRFFVIDVSDKHEQDREYFRKVVDQMDNGGREALLYYLQHYDLSGVDLGSFPMTTALYETKIHSMTPLQKFWFKKLEAGAQLNELDRWEEGVILAEKIYAEFLEDSGKSGCKYHEDQTEFGIGLRKLVPWLKKPRIRRNGVRYYAYKFPSLEECREHWNKLTKASIIWPDKGVSLSMPREEYFNEKDYDNDD